MRTQVNSVALQKDALNAQLTKISLPLAIFEPVSDVKTLKLLTVMDRTLEKRPYHTPFIDHFTPNRQELLALSAVTGFEKGPGKPVINDAPVPPGVPEWLSTPEMVQAMIRGMSFAHYVWLKAGKDGVVFLKRAASCSAGFVSWQLTKGQEPITACYFPALPTDESEIKDTVGAGDSFVGGITAGLAFGLDIRIDEHINQLANIGQM